MNEEIFMTGAPRDVSEEAESLSEELERESRRYSRRLPEEEEARQR